MDVYFSSAKPTTPTKRKGGKAKNVEAESVHVISSDEEGDEKPAKVVNNFNKNLISKLSTFNF